MVTVNGLLVRNLMKIPSHCGTETISNFFRTSDFLNSFWTSYLILWTWQLWPTNQRKHGYNVKCAMHVNYQLLVVFVDWCYARSRCVRHCDMQEHRHAKMNSNYSNSAVRRDEELYDVNINNRNTAGSSSNSSGISSSLRSSCVGLSPDHSNVHRRRGNQDNGCYGSSSGISERDGREVREHHSASVSRGSARSGRGDSTHHETAMPRSARVNRKPRYSLDDH